jgi:hypothetical protein
MKTKTKYALNLYLNSEYGELTLYAFEDYPEEGIIHDTIIARLDMDIEEGDSNIWQAVNYLLKTEGINEDNFHDNYYLIDEWFSPSDLLEGNPPQLIKQWITQLKEGNQN